MSEKTPVQTYNTGLYISLSVNLLGTVFFSVFLFTHFSQRFDLAQAVETPTFLYAFGVLGYLALFLADIFLLTTPFEDPVLGERVTYYLSMIAYVFITGYFGYRAVQYWRKLFDNW